VGPPRGESREKKHHHTDVVIKEKKSERKGRKRKIAEAKEKTSLDKDFELDYSEVFHTANVPQLIATPAGKVVTWNDFFLRATGLSGEEAKRLSIFSIVQADKLSTLFELVANALKNGATKKKRKRKRARQSGAHRDESNSSSAGSGVNKTVDGNSVAGSAAASATTSGTGSETSTASSNKAVDYSAVTLPCVPFQATYPKVHVPTEKNQSPDPKDDDAAKEKSSNDEEAKADADLSIPLYMTVTLMSDDDPRKRCFHCVLSDTPSTSTGKIGSVTPELLAMLFTVDDGEDNDEDEGGFCSSLTNTASNSKANNGSTTLESSTKSGSAAETTSEADGKAESQKKTIAT
jgi:PAS domain S-box-containing protein